MSEERRTRRALARRKMTTADRITLSHIIGGRRKAASWFQPPRITAGRWVIKGEGRQERFVPDLSGVVVRSEDLQDGPHMQVSLHLNNLENVSVQPVADMQTETEHWADALLKCPTSSLNHRTARFCGKPYHWRQDYTGQLKLAAGESPW